MIKRRAVMTDLHGCIDETRALYNKLCWESLDEIWHTGDLVDRGPDSAAVVAFMREHNIKGVMGNHDSVIVEQFKRVGTKNPEKLKTLSQLTDPRDRDYLKALPHLHVFDDIKTVLVHGGLFPHIPLYAQPPMAILRLQLIHPDRKGETRWFVLDKKGIREEEHRKNGWVRWYEVYDYDYNVIFGHSVFDTPLLHQAPGGGLCVGIDTGGVFGGNHTAVILPDLRFISVPGKQYVTRDRY